MKKITTNHKENTEVITWSKKHASLLASFGYIVKSDGDYFHVYQEEIYSNKKIKSELQIIHKNDIVHFLQKNGANIELGEMTTMPRMSFHTSNFR